MSAKTKKSLTEFKGHEDSFATRFVDAIFMDRGTNPPKAIFAKAYSDADYVPSFVDAQHWAANLMNKTKYQPKKRFDSFDLITEIFVRFYAPVLHENADFDEARASAIEYAEEKLSGTVNDLMYGQSPDTPEWFASHIYEECAEIERELDEYTDERLEIEADCKNIDDYYVSKGKKRER